MDQHHPRYRIRLGPLMLLVAMAGLAIALVMEQRRRQVAEELARASVEMARAEAAEIEAAARQGLGLAHPAGSTGR